MEFHGIPIKSQPSCRPHVFRNGKKKTTSEFPKLSGNFGSRVSWEVVSNQQNRWHTFFGTTVHLRSTTNTWVFPKIGKMVNIMENPIKMDDLGGKPTILGNPHIFNPGPFDVANLSLLERTQRIEKLTQIEVCPPPTEQCFSLRIFRSSIGSQDGCVRWKYPNIAMPLIQEFVGLWLPGGWARGKLQSVFSISKLWGLPHWERSYPPNFLGTFTQYVPSSKIHRRQVSVFSSCAFSKHTN